MKTSPHVLLLLDSAFWSQCALSRLLWSNRSRACLRSKVIVLNTCLPQLLLVWRDYHLAKSLLSIGLTSRQQRQQCIFFIIFQVMRHVWRALYFTLRHSESVWKLPRMLQGTLRYIFTHVYIYIYMYIWSLEHIASSRNAAHSDLSAHPFWKQ